MLIINLWISPQALFTRLLNLLKHRLFTFVYLSADYNQVFSTII